MEPKIGDKMKVSPQLTDQAFDMDIKELRDSYGEPYNNAYYAPSGRYRP